MPAYVCLITPENKCVIRSEKPDFDEVKFHEWLAKHGSGYFLRDERSPFDCQYFDEIAFDQMYIFEHGNVGALFRRVFRIAKHS